MKLSALLSFIGSGVLALAAPASHDSCDDSSLSPRPVLVPFPYTPRLPFPNPPERTKVCWIKGHNDGVSDDSCLIMAALHKCNNGGRVVFKADTTYIIGTALDLTFLNHIDIGTLYSSASRFDITARRPVGC